MHTYAHKGTHIHTRYICVCVCTLGYMSFAAKDSFWNYNFKSYFIYIDTFHIFCLMEKDKIFSCKFIP